uniref:Uncharacterized protein n=1 Tax=Moniliophthora roreri TaxID=221103 RepID=A0A0W0GA05_MONRR
MLIAIRAPLNIHPHSQLAKSPIEY